MNRERQGNPGARSLTTLGDVFAAARSLLASLRAIESRRRSLVADDGYRWPLPPLRHLEEFVKLSSELDRAIHASECLLALMLERSMSPTPQLDPGRLQAATRGASELVSELGLLLASERVLFEHDAAMAAVSSAATVVVELFQRPTVRLQDTALDAMVGTDCADAKDSLIGRHGSGARSSRIDALQTLSDALSRAELAAIVAADVMRRGRSGDA